MATAWPGQGPGWVGQILCWSRVLKQTEIAALHAMHDRLHRFVQRDPSLEDGAK